MNIQYKGKDYKIPEPFTKCYFAEDPTHELTIHNRFSDETFSQSCKLPAFAVAIYDSMKDKLVLCRDRLGVKPLYYTKINNFYILSYVISR